MLRNAEILNAFLWSEETLTLPILKVYCEQDKCQAEQDVKFIKAAKFLTGS